jgi:chromosome condensin MukBEF ATPase and DNA-binding subunit MukB|tara:strand:- start:158 stop:553 length:396 start_codon:yes stop_codon:yes gene_type:complete
MQQVFIGIILFLGFTTYYLFNENKTLTANNLVLESAIATQEEAITSLQNDFALQTEQMNELTVKSQAAQRELNRYTQFIQNYQLSAKILADPEEMQRKINNGTKNIMEDIEKISVTVDDLDDGLQLQPSSD